ncbi:ATP-binding protein [Paenibacillus woosongensis]|uniref:histidine kinase n=1 Tax=Paenibacillus woosongensis TaxID=307580 RepID=A0AA95HZQ4_9BACL|nr:ATP-binding protein [Paenibacillus woosongensis]WHX47025.1 ATP-binding protein [Paenibacillus woosongensis]
MKENLFKPFIMGDESRSKDGTGLGLAIVEKLVKLNGGIIELDTNYPGYTKAFVLTFKNDET